MPTWSPARYRALADKCRTEAARKPPSAAKPLLALAEEYEIKAGQVEARRKAVGRSANCFPTP